MAGRLWVEPASCVMCVPGTYKPVNGTSICIDCPAGKLSAAGATVCTDCVAATYSGSGASVCTDCPGGLTSLPGSSSASACTRGYYDGVLTPWRPADPYPRLALAAPLAPQARSVCGRVESKVYGNNGEWATLCEDSVTWDVGEAKVSEQWHGSISQTVRRCSLLSACCFEADFELARERPNFITNSFLEFVCWC